MSFSRIPNFSFFAENETQRFSSHTRVRERDSSSLSLSLLRKYIEYTTRVVVTKNARAQKKRSHKRVPLYRRLKSSFSLTRNQKCEREREVHKKTLNVRNSINLPDCEPQSSTVSSEHRRSEHERVVSPRATLLLV